MRFDAAGQAEIEDVDIARLTDAVDAADALFDRHRIPGQIVVDDGAAELEVAAFAANFGRQQDRGVVLERVDGPLLVHRRQPAVKHADAVAGGRQRRVELVERRAEA